MASQTRQPGTLSSSTTYHASDYAYPIRKAWVNPSNAAANDGSLTTATFIVQAGTVGAGTEMLLATNFGFTIPDGAQIDGVEVTYEMSRIIGAINVFEYVGRMVFGGVIKNTNKADFSTPGIFDGNKTYGSSSDLWGETLTSSIVNATDFGMVVGAQVASLGPNVDSGTARVDVIDLTVHYTVIPPPVTTQAFSDVSSTRGTGNGTITSTGGATPDKRGFVFGVQSVASVGNVAPTASGYDDYYEETGSFSTGAFSSEIIGLPAGSVVFARAYSHNSAGYSYGGEVILNTLNATVSNFLNKDPTEIVRAIVDFYRSVGGSVEYTGLTTELTGLSLDYRFNTNTILEGIQKCREISPSSWYFYVDPGTNLLYFKSTPTTADHVLIKGRHLEKLKLKSTIDEVVNKAYVIGAESEGVNLYSEYEDAASIAAYGQRIVRISDNRISVQATADAKGESAIEAGKDKNYVTTVDVSDATYDTTLYKPGQTVGFSAFRSWVDRLVLRIVRVEYAPSKAILYLGILPKSTLDRLESVQRELVAEQTVANPDEPT